jgi:hypothetical protein
MRAREYFAQSVRVDPQDTYSLYQYSVFLNRCGDKAKWVRRVTRRYLVALPAPDSFVYVCVCACMRACVRVRVRVCVCVCVCVCSWSICCERLKPVRHTVTIPLSVSLV